MEEDRLCVKCGIKYHVVRKSCSKLCKGCRSELYPHHFFKQQRKMPEIHGHEMRL